MEILYIHSLHLDSSLQLHDSHLFKVIRVHSQLSLPVGLSWTHVQPTLLVLCDAVLVNMTGALSFISACLGGWLFHGIGGCVQFKEAE